MEQLGQADSQTYKRKDCQQGDLSLRELRKSLASGASTRQTPTIELERRSFVGVRSVMKELCALSVLFFNLLMYSCFLSRIESNEY